MLICLDVDSNEQAYDDQLKAIQDALTTYGTDHVEGVSIGVPIKAPTTLTQH